MFAFLFCSLFLSVFNGRVVTSNAAQTSGTTSDVIVLHNNMVPVPAECFQPPDSGDCSKDMVRVYYDFSTRTCKPFSYTGCGGNTNRFQSVKNCYRICHPYRFRIKPKIKPKKSAMSRGQYSGQFGGRPSPCS